VFTASLSFQTRSNKSCLTILIKNASGWSSETARKRRLATRVARKGWAGKNEDVRKQKKLVRWKGFEPSRYCYRQPLKLVRLPVPPPPQNQSVASVGCSDQVRRVEETGCHFCYAPIVTDCPAISAEINQTLALISAKRALPIRPATTASGSGMPEAAGQAPERELFQESAQARASK
jgi:hypothetical protein